MASAAPAELRARTAGAAPPKPEAPAFFVAPNGSDSAPCSKSAPCLSWNRAYQVAKPGDLVEVAGGEYGEQIIAARSSTRNLNPGCTPTTPQNCIVFQPAAGQQVTVRNGISARGSSVWIRGTATPSTGIPSRNRAFNIKVSGYVDTEATSPTVFPDHVIFEGVDSTSFGAFNVRTATFRNMDVGPATVGERCRILEGNGFENKIGFAGGIEVVPTDVTIDRVLIHNQNRDEGGNASACHFGGLFIVTVDGLTIKNSVFSQNAVYNIQVQNFAGPPPQNVRIENNWFGCPVHWLHETNLGGQDACNGQVDVQFNAASEFKNWLIRYNSFAAGVGQYVQGASYSNVRIVANVMAGISGCYTGITFAYNVSGARTCAPTDKGVREQLFASAVPGQEDLRVRPTIGARALVPPTSPDYELPLDMEGRVRPIRFPRDAGPLQPDTALITLGHSIGSAAIGMKRADVLERYGQPRRSRAAKLGDAKTPGRVDTFTVPGGILRVTTVDDRVVGLATTSSYYTTPTGLGAGSKRADASRLPGAAWTSCAHAFRRGGRVGISLVAPKATVSEVSMIVRAYATDCAAKKPKKS